MPRSQPPGNLHNLWPYSIVKIAVIKYRITRPTKTDSINVLIFISNTPAAKTKSFHG